MKKLYGHIEDINALDWDKVKSLLISGSYDKTIRFWDI